MNRGTGLLGGTVFNPLATGTKPVYQPHRHSMVPDSKVQGANMGPIWGRKDPGGPHVGPINFAIWGVTLKRIHQNSIKYYGWILHLWTQTGRLRRAPLQWEQMCHTQTHRHKHCSDSKVHGANRTQVGPMLAPWTLLYGYVPLCALWWWYKTLRIELHMNSDEECHDIYWMSS